MNMKSKLLKVENQLVKIFLINEMIAIKLLDSTGRKLKR